MPHSETKQDLLNRCPDVKGLLPEYVEGELSSVEARRLEGHLVLCSACRTEEGRYRAAFATLKAPRPLAPHGDLSVGLAAKLAKYERKSGGRQLQLRWAGAFCLMLAVGGASASFVRTYMSAPGPVNITASQQASTLPPKESGTSKHVADARTQVKPQPSEKPAPESTFEFKNEEPKYTDSAQRDPFDPRGLNPSARPDKSVARAERTQSDRVQSRNTVVSSERERFLSVQPHEGRSADQIIVQKRPEETVAQYSAPSVTPGDDGQPIRIIRPDDKNDTATTASGNTNESNPGIGNQVQPVAVLAEKDSEIDFNGKKTNVKSALGYDKSGRPILVKVNIGPKRIKRIEK